MVDVTSASPAAKWRKAAAVLLACFVAFSLGVMITDELRRPRNSGAAGASVPAQCRLIVYYFYGMERCETCR